MKKTGLNRFSTLSLRGGRLLRNRVVVPPMASGTASTDGFVSDATLAHYERLTESGAGLVMVEYSHVHLSGRSEDNQLGIYCDGQLDGLSRLAQVIQRAGSIAGIQLTHAGGKTSREMTGGILMAPSAVPVPVKDRTMEIPDEMSTRDIQLWKEAFLNASDRAVRAGFDFVELHAAHGYGLNQWLSPLTNRRSDRYGGTREGRALLLLEIIQAIRRRHPRLILSVRMPGQDFLEGGLGFQDTLWIGQELERLGVDLIDVSSGIGGWRRPKERTGQGYLVHEASLIQDGVSVPVIGVGGIETGKFIDALLSEGRISLAAVGRAILQGPRQWAEANLSAA